MDRGLPIDTLALGGVGATINLQPFVRNEHDNIKDGAKQWASEVLVCSRGNGAVSLEASWSPSILTCVCFDRSVHNIMRCLYRQEWTLSENSGPWESKLKCSTRSLRA